MQNINKKLYFDLFDFLTNSFDNQDDLLKFINCQSDRKFTIKYTTKEFDVYCLLNNKLNRTCDALSDDLCYKTFRYLTVLFCKK